MSSRPASRSLAFGSRTIEYRLHFGSRKRLRITVSPDLTVDVHAPPGYTEEEIQEKVSAKAPWIAKKIDHLASFHPLPVPRQYTSGETIVYLGRQYRLKIEAGAETPARLIGRYLIVTTPNPKKREKVKRAVDSWYRTRAKDILSRYLAQCYEIASRHGVPEPKLSIRLMKRRWGSCTPMGRITLNTRLVQVPSHCIEYVIMHELCHLKEPNHAKAFYSLLTRCQPDWRVRKEALDRFMLV
jgi:hypothetical protein